MIQARIDGSNKKSCFPLFYFDVTATDLLETGLLAGMKMKLMFVVLIFFCSFVDSRLYCCTCIVLLLDLSPP
jgi:hypothetical protein